LTALVLGWAVMTQVDGRTVGCGHDGFGGPTVVGQVAELRIQTESPVHSVARVLGRLTSRLGQALLICNDLSIPPPNFFFYDVCAKVTLNTAMRLKASTLISRIFVDRNHMLMIRRELPPTFFVD